MKDNETIEILAIVRGEVQGVGFRATTKHYAIRLGLQGTVRNLSDGSVEICILGSRRDIEELFRLLRENIAFGNLISEVNSKEIHPKNVYEGFRIIF